MSRKNTAHSNSRTIEALNLEKLIHYTQIASGIFLVVGVVLVISQLR